MLNGSQRKAMADQLTTVSKTRFGDLIGQLSDDDLQRVVGAIKVQLAL